MPDKIHIFWDNSNIFIPACFAATKREKGFADTAVRIQFDNLVKLARAGRELSGAMCVGSVPPDLRKVWERLEGDTGVKPELYERGAATNKEQGVDQCLQVHMLRAVTDHPPGVAVLLTGDGAGYDEGIGYRADLERMHKHGWGIEVLSWNSACNRGLKEWVQAVGVYVPLDTFYGSVTFIEGGRKSQPLSLTHRHYAHPIPKE
ncbi:MAG: NYN domain-containing protein [Vicinamibacterales bacterium]